MKTGNKISLLITSGAAIILLALLLVLYLLEKDIDIWMIIALPAISFLIGFFLVRILVTLSLIHI